MTQRPGQQFRQLSTELPAHRLPAATSLRGSQGFIHSRLAFRLASDASKNSTASRQTSRMGSTWSASERKS